MRVLKGHGTENDFVLVPDLDGRRPLTAELVRALCDRHSGLGADGVLRVVRSANEPDAATMAAEAEYFMDYRNADGSVAEMCGNGVRVFMRYLQALRLVDQDAAVATRGGIKRVRSSGDGNVTVQMGQPRILADRPVVTAAPFAPRAALAALEMPNPHVVVVLDLRTELDALDLSRAPSVAPGRAGGNALPEASRGEQNVEFVLRQGPRHLAMRVHERGVGETRSCGTGICAVVAAVATDEGHGADDVPWRVDVPGGTCQVVWRADGEIELTGPAVIVAEIDLDDAWLASVSAADSLLDRR